MRINNHHLKGLLALACLLFAFGMAQAQSLIWQGNICYQNVSSYDVVRVHWQPTNNSWWDTNMTVNGLTIGSVGNGSSYGGSADVPGNSVNLGWVRVGCGGPFGICSAYRPSLDTGQCNPVFEDSQISPTEGYFWFEGARYARASLSVTKTASPSVLAVGASGQSYTIGIAITNGPTTQAVSINDALPSGITTSGPVYANTSIQGCPGAGATSLNGCFIPAGVNGTVVITVPINVSAAATSHNSFYVSNTALVSGGSSSACSNGTCQGSTTNAVLNAEDDTVSKPAGVPSSTDASLNDSYPASSTFTTTGGTCAGISPASPSTNTTGVLNYTLPAAAPSCTVTYQLCAPAPNTTVCDTATLTVNGSGPVIAVSKALNGDRVADTDQFTVQIKSGSTVVAAATTTGFGSGVTGGATGPFAATAGTTYTLTEVASGSTRPEQYSTTMACSNALPVGQGGTDVSAITNVGASISPKAGDIIDCVIRNQQAPATLTVRQMVISPLPPNLVPPYSQQYTGSNGWGQRTITNIRLNQLVPSPTLPLAANSTLTRVSTALPDARWFVASFSCRDNAAAITDNPAVLANSSTPDITIAAANVPAGAALVCTLVLGHLTP